LSDLGLELTLEVVTRLAETNHVDDFNGRIVIKGFSRLLVPSLLMGDTIVWHLVQTPPDQRISYLDMPVTDTGPIGFDDLTSKRHIVGWCLGSLYRAGRAFRPWKRSFIQIHALTFFRIRRFKL
jgi:hypothetical protein